MLLPNLLLADAGTGLQARFTVSMEWEEIEGVRISSATTNVPNYTLAWGLEGDEDADGTHFVVEQAAEIGFSEARRIYSGTDTASFRGGLSEGTYFYRVRALNGDNDGIGPWSPPLQVVVAYQSLRQAITFFAVGAVVVLATVILVIAGTRRDRLELRESGENKNGGAS